MPAALLLEPTTPVPVSAQIGSITRYNNEMPDSQLDPGLTPRTHVGLACLIGLNSINDIIVPESLSLHEAKSIPYSVDRTP